jgi:hypothetical protein
MAVDALFGCAAVGVENLEIGLRQVEADWS